MQNHSKPPTRSLFFKKQATSLKQVRASAAQIVKDQGGKSANLQRRLLLLGEKGHRVVSPEILRIANGLLVPNLDDIIQQGVDSHKHSHGEP